MTHRRWDTGAPCDCGFTSHLGPVSTEHTAAEERFHEPVDLRSLPYADWDTALRESIDNPNRFNYRYQHSLRDWGNFRRHRFDVEPVGAPATHEFTNEWGKTERYGYDPELVDPENGRFGADFHWRGHPGWRREMYRDENGTQGGFREDVSADPSMLYRGLSHEEWEQAKQRGFFQTNGEYNIGNEQGTMFSTRPDQAASYAAGFAPWHRKPGFNAPSYVISIPRPNDAFPHPSFRPDDTSEIVVPGQIPFSQVRQAWQFRPYAIRHGDMDVRTEDFGKTWMGRPTIFGIRNAYRELPMGQQVTSAADGSPVHYNGTVRSHSILSHPLYKRWVFSPATGKVELADNTGNPLDVRYHGDLASRINEPDLVHGYAYRLGDGWRLTDWDSKPLSDPFVVAQVMRTLQASDGHTEPHTAGRPDRHEMNLPQSFGSWSPLFEEDWDRIHGGLPG